VRIASSSEFIILQANHGVFDICGSRAVDNLNFTAQHFSPIKSGVSTFQFVTPSDGAWLAGGVLATKMPLLTELGGGINDIRLFYENDARFLKQF